VVPVGSHPSIECIKSEPTAQAAIIPPSTAQLVREGLAPSTKPTPYDTANQRPPDITALDIDSESIYTINKEIKKI
jgi:hypothetical protein